MKLTRATRAVTSGTSSSACMFRASLSGTFVGTADRPVPESSGRNRTEAHINFLMECMTLPSSDFPFLFGKNDLQRKQNAFPNRALRKNRTAVILREKYPNKFRC
jgi:hypothetical protein